MTKVQDEARKEKARQRAKRWYAANKERATKYKKLYYSRPENIAAKKSYSAKYYRTHKSQHLANTRAWRKANLERVHNIARRQRANPTYQQTRRKWIAAHPEKMRSYQRRAYAKRYKNNPNYRLSRCVRQRIRTFVRGARPRTNVLLGCSFEAYRQYLESRFAKGMNWNNYGFYGWHIDHIRPIASFDLSKPSQLKKAFHYTNTQPLWAKENWQKSARTL